MKRRFPTAIAIAIGLIVLLSRFFLDATLNALGHFFINSAIIVAAFAIILGFFNVMIVHFRKIRRRQRDWPYSIILIVAMWIVLVVGLLDSRGAASPTVRWIFQYIQFPIQATIASLLAFFVASAAYRAFRARNFESILMLVVGIVVLLGQTPLGASMWDQLPALKDWILEVPSLAGARGIILGVSLGTVATGLRVLLGIDRPYSE